MVENNCRVRGGACPSSRARSTVCRGADRRCPVPQLVEDVEFAHVVRHERLHWPIFLSSIGKTPQKQTTFISPKGKEKRIDHIPTKRRHLRHAEDAEANDMIHMGSDHRCVLATSTVTMLEKNIHVKNPRKQDTIEHDEREQAEENIEAVKLELEINTKRSPRKFFLRTATTNNAAAQTESEARKAQNAAAAGAICENAKAKAEEDERMCKGNIMSDSVVTANETDGWHRGRAIVSAPSEDEDHIEFNNDHVKHDMNEDPKESENSADATNDDADNVETEKEAGGRHRGSLVLRPHSERRRRFHRVPQRSCRARHERRHGKKSSTIKQK